MGDLVDRYSVKISVRVLGKRNTSISLCPEFHDALREIAKQRELKVSNLISEVAAVRERQPFPRIPLSHAVRLYILSYYRERAKGVRPL